MTIELQESECKETELKERLNDGFEKAKTVSTSRFSTIREILGETLPKIWTELLAGAKELGGIGREVAGSTATSVKQKLQTEGYVKTEMLRRDAIGWIQTLAEQAKTAWNNLDIKSQATKFDIELDSRYGNSYQTAKQRVDNFLAFYKSSQAKVETGESTGAIEVPYQVMEEKAAHLGATMAQKETQMKQKIQDAVAAVLNS